MTVRYDDPNIEQWWEGRVAYVRHQAQALRDAGWTYPQAVDRHHEFGADDFTWLLLAEPLIDEGHDWYYRGNPLGVDKPDPRKSKDSTNNLRAKPGP